MTRMTREATAEALVEAQARRDELIASDQPLCAMCSGYGIDPQNRGQNCPACYGTGLGPPRDRDTETKKKE